jgi:hypothetical protein
LLELFFGEAGFFFQRERGDLPGNDLNLAVLTTANAATKADKINAQLAGAFKQGLVTSELAAASNGFKVDNKQR